MIRRGSDDVVELAQVGDLIVDAQICGTGHALGVEPAAREAVIVGTLDITGQRIADDDAVIPGDAVDVGKDIVEILGMGLGPAGLLADEGVGDVRGDAAAAQTLPLDGGHRVGDQIQLMILAQPAAHILGVGQQHMADAQRGQMDAASLLGVTLEANLGEKVAEALDYQKILGDLAPVEGRPEAAVAALVDFIILLGIGHIVFPAHGGEGGAVGLIKIKEGIVGVKE